MCFSFGVPAPTPAPTPSPTHEFGHEYNDILHDDALWSDESSWSHSEVPQCDVNWVTVIDHDILFERSDANQRMTGLNQAGQGTMMIVDASLTILNAPLMIVDC